MIVCFGEALLDLYALPLGATHEAAEAFAPRVGGAPANVAVALGRLGARARFVGAVGRDAHGDRLFAALNAASVDTLCVQRRQERTGVAFVRVAPSGERSFLFYRRGGADYALDLAELQGASPLADARWLLVGSSAFVSDPLASSARWLLDEARAAGVSLVVDLNARAHLWSDRAALDHASRALLAQADVVKVSDDDLRALGLAPNLDALEGIARADALVVLTRGAEGWEARRGVFRARGRAHAVDAVDATGAGDAFTAGLLMGLDRRSAQVNDARLTATLEAAAALGARAVTAVGATDALAPPWPEAVQNLLRDKEISP